MNDLSGYGEFDIGGRKLPFKFGTNAYRLFCKHRNIELHEMTEALSEPFGIAELGYFAHVTAMRLSGRMADLDMDSFIELLGDTKDILPEFEKLLLASKMWGYSLEELAEKGKKNI